MALSVLNPPPISTTPPSKSCWRKLASASKSEDVIGAREMLAGADNGTQGAISFALAETYDPNMLAEWGIRAIVADADKARGCRFAVQVRRRATIADMDRHCRPNAG